MGSKNKNKKISRGKPSQNLAYIGVGVAWGQATETDRAHFHHILRTTRYLCATLVYSKTIIHRMVNN